MPRAGCLSSFRRAVPYVLTVVWWWECWWCALVDCCNLTYREGGIAFWCTRFACFCFAACVRCREMELLGWFWRILIVVVFFFFADYTTYYYNYYSLSRPLSASIAFPPRARVPLHHLRSPLTLSHDSISTLPLACSYFACSWSPNKPHRIVFLSGLLTFPA